MRVQNRLTMNNSTGPRNFSEGGVYIPVDHKGEYQPRGLIIGHVMILVIICLAAIIGNSTVISVVLRDRRLHVPTFYFVVNLAIADLLSSLIYIPFYIVCIVKQVWIFHPTFCEYHVFLITVAMNVSLVTLSFISVDRFLDIVFPFSYLTMMTSKRMKLMILLSWVHSIFWAMGPLIKWGEYTFDRASSTCRPNFGADDWVQKSYVICLVTICFALPIIVMFYCYVRIFAVVEKHAKDISKQISSSMASVASIENSSKHSPKIIAKQNFRADNSPVLGIKAISNSSQLEVPVTGPHEVRKPRDLRAHKMILMITVIFLICWLPYSIIAMQRIVKEKTSGRYWTINCSLTLALLSTAVNPLVYSVRDRRFKRGFKKVFSLRFWKSSRSPVNDV